MKDHLAKAKDYIAKGEDFYRKAAEEIVAAMNEEPTLTHREIGDRIGRNKSWVQRLVQWHTSDSRAGSPFGGDQENERKAQVHARQVLREANSDTIRSIVKDLPPKQVERVIQEANEVAVGHARARQSEQRTTSSIRDLTSGEKFDPAEFWADNIVIRVNNNARELASLIQRGGGLLFGAMDYEKAFEYLSEAERLIAEARAAAQEQVRDRTEVV